jgi:predicted ArsR family transcriptional regulator
MVTSLSNVLKETRSEILGCLRSGGDVTVERLSAKLGVSKVSVRRHLDLLRRDGLVEFRLGRPERGRPFHVYSLTDKAELLFPKQYKSFALSVLDQVCSAFGQSGLTCVICAQCEEVMANLKPDLERLEFSSKVKKLSRLLDERGFESSLRKQPDGSYIIRQHNCPVSAVAEKYSEVCDQELRLYRELLGTDVVRLTRIASGDSSCDYRISGPSSIRPEGHPAK